MDDQKNTAALHGLNWQMIVVGLLVMAVIAIAGALAFAWRIGSIAREQLIETLQTRVSRATSNFIACGSRCSLARTSKVKGWCCGIMAEEMSLHSSPWAALLATGLLAHGGNVIYLSGGGPFRARLWRQKPTTLDTFVRMEVDSAS
jgi:hypothetical protein